MHALPVAGNRFKISTPREDHACWFEGPQRRDSSEWCGERSPCRLPLGKVGRTIVGSGESASVTIHKECLDVLSITRDPRNPPDGIGSSRGAKPFPGVESRWEGFVRHDFQVDGANVIVVEPEKPLPGRPWAWRGEFFGAFPNADIELVKRGWHLAYIGVPDLFGSPKAMAHWEKFYDVLVKDHGLTPKPALIGLSRGALYCMAWAAAHPDKTLLVYLDNGVCDFKSWPGGKPKGLGTGRARPRNGRSCSRRTTSRTTRKPSPPSSIRWTTWPRSPRRRSRSCWSTATATRSCRTGRTRRSSTTGTRPWAGRWSGSSSRGRTTTPTD